MSKAILVKVIFQRSDNLPCPWKLLKTFETIISLFTNMCSRQSQKPAVNAAAKQTNAKLIKICICLTQITYRKSPSNHQTPLEEFLTCTRNTIKKLKSIRFSHGSPVLSLLVLFISMSCAELIMRQDKKIPLTMIANHSAKDLKLLPLNPMLPGMVKCRHLKTIIRLY